MHRGALRKTVSQLSQHCFCEVGDSYSGRYPFLLLGLNPILEMRSGSDGWIVTVTDMVSTNRVHGAICPRQVQMDQAVRLGQEQVQVLHGKNKSVF